MLTSALPNSRPVKSSFLKRRANRERARRHLRGCSGPASRAARRLNPWTPSTSSEDEKTPVFPLETVGSRSTDLLDGRRLGLEVPGCRHGSATTAIRHTYPLEVFSLYRYANYFFKNSEVSGIRDLIRTGLPSPQILQKLEILIFFMQVWLPT